VLVADHPRASSAIPAQILGTVAEPYDLSGGLQLVLTANGAATSVTVNFTPADFANINAASAAEVAASINRQTTQVRAAATPNRTVLVASAVAGNATHLAVAAGTATTRLGFAATSSDTIPAASTATLLALQSTAGLLAGSAVRVETPAHVIGQNPLPATVNLALTGGAPAFDVTVSGNPPITVVFTPSDFASGLLSVALSGEIAAAITRQGQGVFSAGLTRDLRLVIRATRHGSGTITLATPTQPVTGVFVDARATVLGATPTGGGGNLEYQQVSSVTEASNLVELSAALTLGLPVSVARVQSVEFDLVVRRGADELERFEAVSMQATLPYYAEAVINDQDRGSLFITVGRIAGSGVGANAPGEVRDTAGRLVATPLSTGSDGTPGDADFIGDPAQRTGLYAFDQVQIQLLACPDTQSAGVTIAALAYCDRRGDAMFVGTPPLGFDLDGAKTYAAGFRGRKVFGALYWPWIDVVNPLDTTGNRPRVTIPPVGHVLGVYARIADSRGVFKAPAGDEALVRNALAVERDITDVDHTDLVKNGGVNAIRAIPGSGIIVDSSRTLSTDTRWLFVGTRRLFNFVKSSLRDGLRWVAQEPHSEELRRAVRFNVVTPFLLGLWRQGAFGSDDPEDVFTVICDASNNPPAEVNLGNFKVEVYFYPVKPAETIIIIVGQQESGAAASEA
jgi:hypothetical protein